MSPGARKGEAVPAARRAPPRGGCPALPPSPRPIEERLKDAELGQALRRPSSADINANRLWMTAVIAALNLSAMLCDLSPLAGASGTAPANTPLRRHAKTLRRALLCVPARITRHARQTILRFAAGYRHLDAFEATWAAAYALPRP